MGSIMGTLGQGQGYLKAGFLGFAKSGKTYTAADVAIGVREFFALSGEIAMYDTEGGSEYIAPVVRERTGKELLGARTRSFDDLLDLGKECIARKVSVLLVDSITHPWRELCDAYLAQLNKRRQENNLRALQKLEFQHWAAVKGIWAEWADFYLNSPLHIIICGRAGYEYAMEENDETGRKELNKTGIRMKTEGEFGFEPSLLVEMERVQEPNGHGGFELRRRATVLGDRFGKIDGMTCDNPTFEFFKPHVEMLKAGAHSTVKTESTTATGADDQGDTDWQREKTARTILAEEIQGELVAKWPGQTAVEKKAKADLLHDVFKTRSWTAVERMPSGKLREGLAVIRETLGTAPKPAPKAEDQLPEHFDADGKPLTAEEQAALDAKDAEEMARQPGADG